MRVAVLVGLFPHEQTPRPQVVDDRRIGVLHERPARGHGLVEGAVGVDRVEHWEAFPATDLEVVLAEGRGQVHDAGAIVGADEVGRHDPPGLAAGIGGVRKSKGRW